MALTKVINTGIKNSEITTVKLNVASSFSFDSLTSNTIETDVITANNINSDTFNLVSSYANSAFSVANTAQVTGSGLFNNAVNVSVGYFITDTMANAAVFSSNAIVHSIYVVNIASSNTLNVSVSGEIITPETSNNKLFDNIYVPPNSSLELLRKPQVVRNGDYIQMQSFNDGTPVSSNATVFITYETKSTSSYYERSIKKSNTSYQNLYTSTTYPSVIESIKLVNNNLNYANHSVTIVWTNSANTIQAYIAKDFILPANSTVELTEDPKFINENDKIDFFSPVDDSITVCLSAKKNING